MSAGIVDTLGQEVVKGDYLFYPMSGGGMRLYRILEWAGSRLTVEYLNRMDNWEQTYATASRIPRKAIKIEREEGERLMTLQAFKAL